MGNFLNAPLTDKSSEKGNGNGLSYGLSSMQGWRAAMEDAHTAVVSVPNFPSASLYAVFDGHGGCLAAEYSAREITNVVTKDNEFKDNMNQDDIGKVMVDSFMKLDDQIRALEEVEKGFDHSGCTAIAAFVTDSHIIVSNTGDSRSVLAKGKQTVPMSFDHKPYDDKEQRRILKAGGTVQNKRVNGDLAVSRALGDFAYKGQTHLPAREQQVSAEPDIKIEERNGEEEFLVIACDGIWDVMSNDEICEFVRELLLAGENDLSLVAEELLDHCLKIGSRDNMSVIVIAFPAIQYGKGSGVMGRREKRDSEENERKSKQGQ